MKKKIFRRINNQLVEIPEKVIGRRYSCSTDKQGNPICIEFTVEQEQQRDKDELKFRNKTLEEPEETLEDRIRRLEDQIASLTS